MISPATAARLPPRCVGDRVDAGFLLAARPVADGPPEPPAEAPTSTSARRSAPPARAPAQRSVEDEHRSISSGSSSSPAADELLAEHGADALTDAVTYVVDAVQEAAAANDVTLLATDLAENGGKFIMTPARRGCRAMTRHGCCRPLRRVVHPGGRLALRAGVTCGSVFAGDYGPFYRKTYSIAGDVVNLAARLMSKALPGQVIATHCRRRTLAERFRDHAARGRSPSRARHSPIEAVLVGDLRRESEPVTEDRLPLSAATPNSQCCLSTRPTSAFQGRGSVVDIVGHARHRQVPADRGTRPTRVDARMLWADGDIYGRATPYQPMQRLLRRTLDPADRRRPTRSSVTR